MIPLGNLDHLDRQEVRGGFLRCSDQDQTVQEKHVRPQPLVGSEAANDLHSRSGRNWRAFLWTIFKVVVSVACHVGFIASILAVVWSRRQAALDPDLTGSRYHRYYLVASSLAGFLYIVMLVEAAACDTYHFIRTFSSKTSVQEYVQRVRDACPLVRWRAECYHYDIRSQTRLQRDAKGRVNIRQLRHREKMVTHRETEAFKFNKWRDISRDVAGLLNSDVVRIECTKVFIFRDEASKDTYMTQYYRFRDRNRHKDEFMEHTEEFVIPGYQSRLTACAHTHARPCWLSELWFWISTILLLTWPYRWLFRHMSTEVCVVFIKELEV